MTGNEQDASIQRDESHLRFSGPLVRGRVPTARRILVGFAQCLILMISLVLAATGAMAQVSTTGISGVVQDPSGAVVANASIVATQTETNYAAKTVSGADGGFALTSLPVGPYTLTVTADGFAPYTQTGLVLSVAQVSDVQVKLAVGQVAQQVTVRADSVTVQVSEPTIQTIVPEEIVKYLPLNGRQVGDVLYDTVPGVRLTRIWPYRPQ
jgi:hypothetical protein